MKIRIKKAFPALMIALGMIVVAGCTPFNMGGGSEPSSTVASASTTAPYYPPNIRDIQVPGELEHNRDNSMYINTSSFAGGVISFQGRVEVTSLTDFFIITMEKHGWKNVGSARYKNVLLAFTKPNKTCMVSIVDPGFGMKTQVNVYISEDIENRAPGRSEGNL